MIIVRHGKDTVRKLWEEYEDTHCMCVRSIDPSDAASDAETPSTRIGA
jgi:hypothetical protein